MKKIIYGGLFLTIVGITFVGCTKEKMQQVKETSTQQSHSVIFDKRYHIATDKKLLIFESSGAYDSIVSSTDSAFVANFVTTLASLNLKSYQDLLIKNPNLNDQVGDSFLSSMLNEDRIIQIGKFFYKIDAKNEQVFVLSQEYISQLDDLVNDNTANSNILVYSTEDEVIRLVENGLPSASRGVFCGDRWATKKNKLSDEVIVSTANGFKMVLENRYQALGIYFLLKSSGIYNSTLQGTLKYYFQLDNCSYAQRCGSSISNYSHPWRVATTNWSGGATSTDVFKFYQGVKALKSYDYKVRFRCENWNILSYPNPYTIFFTSYVQISD